jgi:solute carrier family 25 phosphate transporter 23/24/25/41
MWKEEGWRGFMRGNGTNCIRIVPYSAVQFGSYNFYKRVGSPGHRGKDGILEGVGLTFFGIALL